MVLGFQCISFEETQFHNNLINFSHKASMCKTAKKLRYSRKSDYKIYTSAEDNSSEEIKQGKTKYEKKTVSQSP